jgi:hypothetical protein
MSRRAASGQARGAALDRLTSVRASEQADGAPLAAPAVERSPRLLLLVALSACAGAIHARAFVDHVSHYWLFGVLFALLTYAQVLWAVWIYRAPGDERALMPAAVVSLGVVAVWLVSRTVGLPIGPWAGRPEPFGIADVVASLDELVLAGLIVAIVRPDRWLAARLAWLDGAHGTRVTWMVVTVSLLATAFGKHTHPTTR